MGGAHVALPQFLGLRGQLNAFSEIFVFTLFYIRITLDFILQRLALVLSTTNKNVLL